ncbi:amidohydrolase family protein [Maribacter sp. PR1]|uniref:Amidohydrolase family protein n=1 Tax=Maribacter cobaltidurans TaxID=1178778 RepID=A0ABU7IPD9_9FLAO|nr:MULTISPECIES: amidohydrolase family protein [Maribacter]MDC6387426.1 amidohydrolase family protein [Maribacter sp. PR1]MEE1974813.1 amidohydrolase family protein [Maribacter cobaltidurans]
MIIDAHQHFWMYEAEKHAWIDDEMSSIRRNFLPSDLKPLYEKNGVTGCIAVQADQTLKENDFLLEQARKHDFIKGIIGWIDLRSNELENDLDNYAQYPIIKGYRHVVQAESDPLFLLRNEFLRGISELQKRDLVYEILVFPHQLPSVLEFVKHFPDITFVLDHMAKPYIKEGFFEAWALLMREIGRIENVNCKVSGLITEADYQTWTEQEILPYLGLVLEAFGPKRILYGSDWPVCLIAGEYKEVLALAKNFADKLSANEQRDFFYHNAQRVYNLIN